MQSTSMPYTLHDSTEINGDTMNELALVCDEKYMNFAQENSRWYLEKEVGSVYTTVYLNKMLVPRLNVEVVTNNL